MQPIAQNRRIASFFTAKTKSTIVIPKPHQLEAWDIDHIVNFIGDAMNKNEELPLDVLQRKTSSDQYRYHVETTVRHW
jgi:hypothetical protein